jgi:aminoglycoside phosphotransferase (APT) family kinase protein
VAHRYRRNVPDKPAAEIIIDESLVRRLLVSQATRVVPDAATLPLWKAAEGWDCEVWRAGAQLAVRLPRRMIAAPLVLNEQRVLPRLATRIEATGVRVPAPVFGGSPDDGYPWSWSVVPWIDGTRGIDVPRGDRYGWADALAAALAALHAPAPSDFPVNPFRGVPLATRSSAIAERLTQLRDAGTLDDRQAEAAAPVWSRGVAAAPWAHEPVWIHGDLHPANLVAQASRLTGIIDFGDVTAGDPAYDLAVAWLAFDREGRERFVLATDGRYDRATWVRAHAWAAAVSLMLLAHSDDEPAYAALGREAFGEVTGAPPGPS